VSIRPPAGPRRRYFLSMRLGGSVLLTVATVATAVGACAIGASVMSPVAFGVAGDWLVAGGGVIALLSGLTYLVVWFGRRDRHLR
jgi:hypothetical protein